MGKARAIRFKGVAMNESNEEFRESGRDILEYLNSLRLLASDLDVTIKTEHYFGCINVRGGRVVAAKVGDISGNGGLFTLLTQKSGEITSVKSTESVTGNVTVSHEQMEYIYNKVPSVSPVHNDKTEAGGLEDAVHLFLQFRKKEAGALLVEILRKNRFYYPAWLWHSRLMNRAEYLSKAIAEMKKWGGHDPEVAAEIGKISPQLSSQTGSIKRCIFCWAIVETGQEYCHTCNCYLSVSARRSESPKGNAELEAAIKLYEEEFGKKPDNSRIAYCLCLGMFSLGNLEAATGYLEKALHISPKEQLFVRTSHYLQNLLPAKTAPKEDEQKLAPKAPVTSKVAGLRSTPVKKPAESASAGTNEKTILVIEDSPTSRKVIAMVLERQGYEIVEATTGGEGIAHLINVVPDLVLLDVMLPDMDGYQVLGEIRANKRLQDVPVVMLTGKRSSTDRMKGLASGANEYLTKPFDPAKLVKVLDRFVKKGTAKPAVVPVKKVPAVQPTRMTKKPLRKVAAPAAQPVLQKPAAKSSGPSILIVEDSPTTRKVISLVLSRKGYPFREATTGKEALTAIQEEAPRLILLDAMLPDMTGYSILVQLQKDDGLKDIPVVMLTAKTGATDRQKGMQAGAVAYLTKPFDPNKLISTVAQYLPAGLSVTT